ncbi:cobaltochelatase subunit CobN [Magnetospira sp. QH-2]|uniref:cobaltochelatase subunit CobN n=1 Tax=Magnetospira sp. (strain QH-2) TaxID=1288970 RepID=UPI0003E81803|nr:cobaltochelatase subunit CobN [Magnetospira sp. QH-2]CCQ72043.1 Aerobic cobaltochelatase subunit cobN [Magnetospira sp. QH-2]
MHLLAATPGEITDGSEAIDLGQTPGDIIVLSAADTEIACLARANRQRLADNVQIPSLRLASLLHLGHPLSVDLYVETIIAKARLVVIRLLGGRAYWAYGVEQIIECCHRHQIPLALLPGDDQPDPDLLESSTLDAAAVHRLWQYLVYGGLENSQMFLAYAESLLGSETIWAEPAPLLKAGLYQSATLDDLRRNWVANGPIAAVVFYRALLLSGNTAGIDAIINELKQRHINVLPIFVGSLKDSVAQGVLADIFEQAVPNIILNATAFAVAAPGGKSPPSPLSAPGCPVLQLVASGGTVQNWRDGTRGLSARDIAMNVALPEVDGRILAGVISFKGPAERDEATQCDLVAYEPEPDRVRFIADLATNWINLGETPTENRRVALILANYPTRDGRLGNGVGLDTPAAAVGILRALRAEGYESDEIPSDGDALIRRLLEGPTNQRDRDRQTRAKLSLADYEAWFHRLPLEARRKILARWGTPEADPRFADDGGFQVAVLPLGNVVVGIQPARGYDIDPQSSYHDPDLVPPHGYLAFYAWLSQQFGAQAIIHLGKHGNLEWLPGKSLALSDECYPQAILGPLPHLYPFIVNDPGEGTQAKRRTQGVIIDHLTPPLTRAESYGPLRDLERLVDEYYEAAGVDPRRLRLLRDEILSLCRVTGLDTDCGIAEGEGEDEALGKLDNYLCELKELQIRDGLHVFGESPSGDLRTHLLVALARVPRGDGKGGRASLLRALADDLSLGFDPLDCQLGDPWLGPRPQILAGDDPWRTIGDTVERLEILAADLVGGKRQAEASWPRAEAVLEAITNQIGPAVAACGEAEMNALLRGLDGKFVDPGPSGAPTRGRPDVLPTGRNFYSVDVRAVPTQAAWSLGWKSATLLIERHAQEQGDWPRRLALTAWGTSNMRTGGDDISQALALLGVTPTWDRISGRVTGFEILPATVLGRPRVDVTLRVSGFFRDAFPGLIDLFDSATRAVADLDEPAEENPLAARVREERAGLMAEGASADQARRRAGTRVFGSKPGAYGAGLQALIDEKGWDSADDLARAYVAWGGWAYGAGAEGDQAHDLFETRLGAVEAVIQNQDNREHDILDSDDYYQFEGGMTAAVRMLSGQQPTVYHGDHSRPETPVIRTLDEEVARVVRARAANPKWIAGVMRHGYKGAFEMAATVDYLFAFAATARCVRDHHFDALFEAYLGDDQVRQFIADHNPAALNEMAERFQEALDRHLWRPRRNSTPDRLAGILAPGEDR